MAIRTAVVGLGMGRHHAGLIKNVKGLEVSAVCDLDQAKCRQAAADLGARPIPAFEDVLADDAIDLVVIVTSHDVHCDMVVRSLKAGKHTVVDKPFCLTVAEADKMIAARDKSGKMLSCFHCRRWDPDYLTVLKALETGAIGKLLQVQINQAGYYGQRSWRAVRKHMGGLFYDWGAHFADQLCQLGGPIASVSAVVQYGPHGLEVEDFVHVIVQFRNGMLGLVNQSGMSHFTGPRWIMSGDKGSLKEDGQGHGQWDEAVVPAIIKTTLNGVPVEIQSPKVAGKWDSYYENVSAHLNEGKPLAVTAEQARDAVELMQAAYISAEDGKPVALPLKGKLAARAPSQVRPKAGK